MPPDRDGSADIDAMVDSWLSEGGGESSTPDTGTPDTGTPDAPTTPDAQATPTTQPPAGDTGQPQGDAGKPADPKTGQQPPAQQEPKAGPGDLVDREGRVIAKAGAERRHYEAAQRLTGEVQTMRGRMATMEAELNAYRQAAQMPQQLGLSVDDQATGLQLVASWKTNPVGVIEYLVEQAKAMGHNLDTLGGKTDVGAIKAMIASELAPFREQAQSVQQRQEAQTAAEQQVSSLVAEYGEQALVNGDALSKLIDAAQQAGKPLTLEQTYLRFSNWCLQNGYDPHQPIDPQIAARRGQPAPQAPANPQQRMPPRPNGRAVAAPTGVEPVDPGAGMTGSETMRDIVRASLREAGFQL